MPKKNNKTTKNEASVKDLKPKANPKGGSDSQSTGAGAGKVTFNPFSVKRP